MQCSYQCEEEVINPPLSSTIIFEGSDNFYIYLYINYN